MIANPPSWANIYFDPKEIASRAHFATEHGQIDAWFRQTPGQDGIFGRTAFAEEASGDPGEWLVVCDEPPAGLRTRIPVERRVLFLGEPPSIKIYPTPYLNQFGLVVGPFALPGYEGCHIRQHASLPWHYGRSRPFSWRELAADKVKSRTISVFCSSKKLTVQQAFRIRFVEALKAHFGPRIEHFGHGFRPIEEKADGLSPFRYTIVLENNLTEGFWTEKLADAYLAGCFPIYAGGKIPAEDFDPRARLDIDVFKVGDSLRAIEDLIGTADFDALSNSVREQRRRVMLQHNLFAVAERLIEVRRDRAGLLARPASVLRSQDARLTP
ncbi:hypothetical protein [Mesorhizobium sp. KR9-304]|uniref:hypothetical protein n=1 Tax=Mesorhizobium sp. KR9-304 TaxID=3156614 RepID=UPI0032B38800